jgi:alpha-tubulin suppressor-like RCC1 family protein
VPVEVTVGNGWSTISAAQSVTSASWCGVKFGELHCWGTNESGQLGNGATGGGTGWARRIGTLIGWQSVSISSSHTCGLRYGEIYCWGTNGFGMVGDGTTMQRLSPTALGETAFRIRTQTSRSCAIRDGELFCWGRNGSGQLDNQTEENLLVPTRIGMEGDWQDVSGTDDSMFGVRAGNLYQWDGDGFEPIGLPSEWTSVSCSTVHCCGLRGGTLQCWGANNDYQLGLGTAHLQTMPARVGTHSDWNVVSTGPKKTCAIRNGELYCWGTNTGGLGYGYTLTPTLTNP